MQDKNLELMKNAPIPKAVLSLALPTVFSSIVILLYNLADTYFIGMLNDKFQLGAVSLAYPIFTVVQAIGNIFAIGTSPYISRCLGAQEHDKVKRASSVAVWTSVGITLALTVNQPELSADSNGHPSKSVVVLRLQKPNKITETEETAMKGARRILQMLAGGFLTAALLAGPALAANPEIRVGSWKGNTLEAGDRSLLMIGPAGAEYTAESSNPEAIAVERVLTYWVAVAKAEGVAEITVTDEAGTTGSLKLTVEAAGAAGSSQEGTSAPAQAEVNLTANMDIRLEMVRLINEVRRENGLAELPTDESLMNAAQNVSSQCVTEHRPYDHMALIRYGWPHGGLYNLAVFTAYGCPDIARQAIDYWIASPGHYATMLLEGASHVGTGVTFKNGKAYCYMVVGDPTGHNPYE